MTIGFTKKLLLLAVSASMLALGAAPAGFAGGDDGPTANGEQLGSVLQSSSSPSSSNGSSSSGSSRGASAKGGVKAATVHVKAAKRTLIARRDTVRATGAAQTGFGGMADTPGENLLFALFIGLGGLAAVAGVRGLSLERRSDR